MLKHSQSMPRALDGNNSVSSNFSIRTNMLTSLNAKDKIPEHYIQKVTSEADILVAVALPDGIGRTVQEDLGRHQETEHNPEGHLEQHQLRHSVQEIPPYNHPNFPLD
jgi:hypothetical protein